MDAADNLPGEITGLLHRWGDGDRQVPGELASLAYDELRAIASGYLHREHPYHTLQATGLVNELYIRLAQQQSVQLSDRRHFYAFAAMMMRRILGDYARRGRAEKRPEANAIRVPLHDDMAWISAAGDDMISLDLALNELETVAPRKARVIELRYFLGCTNEEAAEVLGLTRATIDRDLQFAKTWLFSRLRPNG
jgi:RNA polymerase sigma factor (TIGR02999 family)